MELDRSVHFLTRTRAVPVKLLLAIGDEQSSVSMMIYSIEYEEPDLVLSNRFIVSIDGLQAIEVNAPVPLETLIKKIKEFAVVLNKTKALGITGVSVQSTAPVNIAIHDQGQVIDIKLLNQDTNMAKVVKKDMERVLIQLAEQAAKKIVSSIITTITKVNVTEETKEIAELTEADIEILLANDDDLV